MEEGRRILTVYLRWKMEGDINCIFKMEDGDRYEERRI